MNSLGLFGFSGPIVAPELPNGTIVTVAFVGDIVPSNLTVNANSSATFSYLATFRSLSCDYLLVSYFTAS
jgi:hypothetical protein